MTDLTRNEVEATDATTKVPVPLDGPLADADQAWRLARFFAAADIVPQDLRNKPANAFLVILYGQRLGIPPEIALSTVSVVKGKPRMAGQLLLAKVREAGHVPFIPCATCGQMPGGDVHRKPGSDNYHPFVADRDDKHCTFTIVRSGGEEEHTETFTLDDAVRAGLCKIKDGKVQARSQKGEALPWENYTERMLMWRALGFCVDVICPEIKMGFVVEGELDEAAPSRPTLAQVAAQRMDQQAQDAAEEPPADPPNQPADPPSEEVAHEETPPVGGAQADLLADLADIEAEHNAEYPDGGK